MNQPENQNGKAPEFYRGIDAVLLAHVASTQGQIERQNKHNEDLRQAVNREAVPVLTEEPEADMGTSLSIDSPTTVNHYHKQETEPTSEKKRLGTLGKMALAAGLVASGAGGAVGIMAAAKSLNKPEKTEVKPAPIVRPAENSERKYSLDLGD